MVTVHELSRTEARRIAVRAQLLTKHRLTDGIETVRRLSLVQIEPTTAIAPSAELVLWSRLGSLVGKLDARADRDAGVLRVAAVHQDVPFTKAMAAAVDSEIRDLARWLGVELVRPPEVSCPAFRRNGSRFDTDRVVMTLVRWAQSFLDAPDAQEYAWLQALRSAR